MLEFVVALGHRQRQQATGSVVDELSPELERLGAAGLPIVIVVEDVHAADPTLVELARLMAAGQSRVLLVATSWEGMLEETDRPAAALLARVPAERSRRVRGGVDVGDLSVDDRLALAVEVLPARSRGRSVVG
jgi:hypothetical protein